MRPNFFALGVLSIALTTFGCASSPIVSFARPTVRPTPKEYNQVHARWTRHGHITYDFDSAAIVDATMQSHQFRAAYTERFLKLYNVAESEHAEKRALSDAAGDAAIEFHAEVAMHTYELSDLASKRSNWRITLIDDGGRELKPTEIREKRDRKEFTQHFYPHTNEFTRSWAFRFPNVYKDGTAFWSDATRSLTLRLAGPIGTVDLVWRSR